MDAGKDGCRKRRMHERRDAERRESRLEGYRKGGFRIGEMLYCTVDRRIKDSWEAGQVGYRTGGN